MTKVKMDIRQFALPVPRSGSIETHSGYGAPPLSGQEIHQIIQRNMERQNENFVSEKAFSLDIEHEKYTFQVSGRADGFIENASTIIEIKTAFDIDELAKKLENNFQHPYIFQLRTYGYIFLKNTGKFPVLKMLLVSSRNIKKKKELLIDLLPDQYEEWMKLRLDECLIETKLKEKVHAKRLLKSQSLSFPFERPRPGQMELIQSVDEHFKSSNPVLIQAPTGLGKTAGVLYPALKEALSRGQKLIYVTPKNSQHKLAEEAVDLINEKSGTKIKRMTLTSKSKMCLKAEPLCNPVYCEYAKDYYAKVDQHKLVEKIQKVQNLTAKKCIKIGEEFQVCPFELSLEGIQFSDVVVGDYNYVFSPRSLIGRLSEPIITKEKPNLVIDEAHNLPSRAQDYFSPKLSSRDLLFIKDEMKKVPKKFAESGMEFVEEILVLIKSYGLEGGSRKIDIAVEEFAELDKRIRDFTLDYLESDAEVVPGDPVLKLSNVFSGFVEALESTGEEFFQTYQKSGNEELLKITCSDASAQLKLAYKEFKNTAAFSATLKPFAYYQELMGFDGEKTKTIEFSSPFKKDNRKILMIPQISTKYKDRSMSAPKICEVIEKILSLKSGNYIALFPSFEFMLNVAQKLNVPGYQILEQRREMKANLVDNYLEVLKSNDRPTLLLGVQGGIFSEGVDYPGNMLIGAFVIGPALPNFDFEREQIKAYYEKRYGRENGFDYAYVYPAMAKAIQSAGRVIRTETDRGIIILIDPRFLETSYSSTMPSEWFQSTPRELLSSSILNDLKNFWKEGV